MQMYATCEQYVYNNEMYSMFIQNMQLINQYKYKLTIIYDVDYVFETNPKSYQKNHSWHTVWPKARVLNKHTVNKIDSTSQVKGQSKVSEEISDKFNI